jgi:hypothetical protein
VVDLNEEFCPRWNAANGWEYLGQSLLLHGDGIAIIQRKGGMKLGQIDGIEPVHPNATTILPTPDYKRLVYVITRPWGESRFTTRTTFCTSRASALTASADCRRFEISFA